MYAIRSYYVGGGRLRAVDIDIGHRRRVGIIEGGAEIVESRFGKPTDRGLPALADPGRRRCGAVGGEAGVGAVDDGAGVVVSYNFV